VAVPETLDRNSIFTWLTIQEDFNAVTIMPYPSYFMLRKETWYLLYRMLGGL
jgi:hypothetical protein